MIKNILSIWILLCVTAIGALESDMWDNIREGGTFAWAVHTTGTDDNFNSIAVISTNSSEDELWAVVERNSVQYIEKFRPMDWYANEDINDAWFVDCGGDQIEVYHPAVAGETAYGDYTKYFIGYSRISAGNVIAKATTDSVIDTTWGTSGYWGAGSSSECYCLYQFDDGRMLAGTNYNNTVVMLDENGDIDTTWATSGYYVTADSFVNVVEVLEDSSGNIYMICNCNDGATYALHKLDSDGTKILSRSWTSAPKILRNPTGAIWHDSNKTKILLYGNSGNYPTVSYVTNCVLINASTLEPVQDTSWGGVLHYFTAPGVLKAQADGYALVTNEYGTYESNYNIEQIIKASDGNYFVKHNSLNDTGKNSVSKMAEDGKSYITAWGDSGHSVAGYVTSTYKSSMCEINENLYSIARYEVVGEYDQYDNLLRKWDSDGTIVASERLSSSPNTNDVYLYLTNINDKLVLGTRKVSPAQYNIEIWTTGLVYESGFDVSGMSSSTYIKYIIPDETTREEYTGGDYIEYFLGVSGNGTQNILYKVDSDNVLDTDWGTNGRWGFTDETTLEATGYLHDMHELSDGRLLVAHDEVTTGADADHTCWTMLTVDGAIDTTWGDSGHYYSWYLNDYQYDLQYPTKILEDDDGNFYLFGQGGYNFHKIDSDGTLIYAKGWNAPGGVDYFGNYVYDACWYDSNKTRIIAVCSDFQNPENIESNIVAFDPSDGEADTTWTGNLDSGGYAYYSHEDLGDRECYAIKPHQDGFLIVTTDQDAYCISKILADGSNYDTTFGESGSINSGCALGYVIEQAVIVDDDDNIWTLCSETLNSKTQKFAKWDEDGTYLGGTTMTGGVTGVYHNFILFNDYIIFGTNLSSPANYQIERWNNSTYTYIDGFDPNQSDISLFLNMNVCDYTRESSITEGSAAYWETIDVNYARFEDVNVCVFADGNSVGTYLVTDGNLVDFNDTYDYVLAGLNYYSIYESFPIIAQEITKNQDTKIQRVAMDLYETYGLNLGVDLATSSEISFDSLYTGYKIAEFPRGTREPVIYMWIWEPLPFCLRGLYLHEEIKLE